MLLHFLTATMKNLLHAGVMTGLLWSTHGKYASHPEKQDGGCSAELVYEHAIKGTAPLMLKTVLPKMKSFRLNTMQDNTEIQL